MKASNKKPIDISKASDQEILSYVASKLKGRVLFPRMVKEAKFHLKQLKRSESK